jgi:CubicO group peptidase (beta-lactamase class C family)
VVCVAAVAAVGVNANVATAQATPSERGPENSDELETFLDEFMASEMERLDIPGAAVVVVRDGETLLSSGYGFADRDDQVRVDPATTLFDIGSVAKPLTAVAAVQQVEQGSVALETDINEVLDISVPDYRGTEVTLGSLLTHTSGFEERLIGYWTEDADDVGPLGEFEADHVPSRFAATGEVHSYSNHNYGFAGLVVEQVSGQDFVAYMGDNVFGPIGMDSTGYRHAIQSDLASRVAVGYGGSEGSRSPTEPVYDHEYPAGEVVTTPEDMAQFMLALLEDGQVDGGRIMSPDTTALYLAPAYRPEPDMPGRTTGGLEEMWINGEQAVGHGGDSLAGFAAEMVLLPERDTGIFVAYNVASDEFRTTVVDAIFDEFYPDETPEPTFVDLDADGLGRFAGTYQWTRFARSTADKVLAMTPPFNTYVDANDDGTLTVRWLGVSERWIYRPTGPTLFERVSGEPAVVDGLVLDPGERISFTIDDGDVTYLHTSLHTIALRKVPFLGLGIVHMSAFGTIVIVFVLSLLVWPIGAFIRKRRNHRRAARAQLSEPDQPAEPVATNEPAEPLETSEQAGSGTGTEPVETWPPPASATPNTPTLLREPTVGARAALWLEIGVAICLLLGTVAFFLTVSNSDVAFGPTLSLYLAAGLITIASLASLALIPAAIGSWIRGWFTIGGRIFYSLLALTAPYLLWWAITWNFLGFQF